MVLAQILATAIECVGQLMVPLDCRANRFGRRLFPEPMRDVRHVAATRGKVPFQRLGRQITGFPTPNRGHEVGQMSGFQRLRTTVVREVLDLVSRLVKYRSAGGIACEVTPFAIDDDPAVPAPELPQRGTTLGVLRLRISQTSGAG